MKVDAKDLCPETRGLIVDFIVRAQRQRFQHHDQQRQSHGELRKQVMKCRGKGKMQPVNQQRTIHSCSLVVLPACGLWVNTQSYGVLYAHAMAVCKN